MYFIDIKGPFTVTNHFFLTKINFYFFCRDVWKSITFNEIIIDIALFICPFCQTDFLAKWVQVFKSGQSKICGRQPLKKFIWSTLEYCDSSWIAIFKSLSAVWADLYSQPITYGSKYNMTIFFRTSHILLSYSASL